jgi:hypothetical protein
MREFLANERCDRCGARARHAASKGLYELLFCNHHFAEHKVALLDEYWTVESDLSPAEPVPAAAYTE